MASLVSGKVQRHGNSGRGQQPAPPQGASDKTSGSISTPMPSSAPPGIPPEPPAVHGSLPGDDEAARLPSLVSKLSPLAASKRPAGALSPTDVALFPTSPVHRRGLLQGGKPHARHPSSQRVPRQPTLRAFRPLHRALLSARGGLFPLLDPTPPPNEGGGEDIDKRPYPDCPLERASLYIGRRACYIGLP